MAKYYSILTTLFQKKKYIFSLIARIKQNYGRLDIRVLSYALCFITQIRYCQGVMEEQDHKLSNYVQQLGDLKDLVSISAFHCLQLKFFFTKSGLLVTVLNMSVRASECLGHSFGHIDILFVVNVLLAL